MPHTASRPKFLNLLLIRMPVGAVASIGHRISGVFLFLSLPLAAFLLDLSLQGQAGFEQAAQLLSFPWLRLVQVVLAWSIAHHALAGLRFLLIDVDVGVEKPTARASALAVNLTAPILALLFLWSIW